jgi:hypothetical protein
MGWMRVRTFDRFVPGAGALAKRRKTVMSETTTTTAHRHQRGQPTTPVRPRGCWGTTYDYSVIEITRS